MIRRGHLSDYFQGVAVKRLSVVETTPSVSHQHEFNGVGPLLQLFGEPDRPGIPARFIWLGDEQEAITDDATVTWYDSRRNKRPRREYRLYYPGNAVSEVMQAGDTLFIALRPDGTVMVIITPADSTIQNQLLWMFGVNHAEPQFTVKELAERESATLDFAVRYILDELEIEAEEPDAERLDELLAPFGSKFPTTREFSELARRSLTHIHALDDPDQVLMAWVDREESLFRRLERHLVADRLRAGFMAGEGADVEGFLSFSLSVQNRRKSRAGQSLENHLEALFSARDLRFARGALTEDHNKPDFLFPGDREYHDLKFPAVRLTMLGAKSTCKDRWPQVLAEARRIAQKHLLTLEPGISEHQTDRMRATQLQLILPQPLHETFREAQQDWLMNVSEFIELVRGRQDPPQPA
jgi:hypothetical protein